MTARDTKVNPIEAAMARHDADIAHIGIFDYSTMFRERRLRRADVLATLDTAVFGNVVTKWDTAESIVFPGPYRSETIALDADSVRPFPFEPNAVSIVADFTGPHASIMPRKVLREQVDRATRMGFEVDACFEFEFIVLNETAESLRAKNFTNLALYASDNRCWSGQTAATFAPFVSGLEDVLTKADIGVYSLSVELGPGCFEATLRHKPAMRAADDAAFFRMHTKVYCRQKGLTASFMAMTGAGFPGIGGHCTVSLRDPRSGSNLFADKNDEYGLSDLAKSYVAGVIDIVPEAFPLCAHTVNDYRRLAPGSWAPKTVSWAPYNYAAAIRTCAETEASTRLEFRLPGSDCNVYLALALFLGAGLDGIERKLPLDADPIKSGGPHETPPGAPRLPVDLLDATNRMRLSHKAKRVFGREFVEHFAIMCEAEDVSLRRAVSAEEVKRYLEAG